MRAQLILIGMQTVVNNSCPLELKQYELYEENKKNVLLRMEKHDLLCLQHHEHREYLPVCDALGLGL